MESPVTPFALLVSWADNPPLEPLSTVLEEYFGYNTISVRLQGPNGEQSLRTNLANALIRHTSTASPFILYFYGNSLTRPGQSRLLLPGSDNSVPVDWIKLRQDHIDKSKSSVLVVIDCNYKVVQKMKNRYPILEDDMDPQSKSIVQVIVAPKFSDQVPISFADMMANTLRDMTQSTTCNMINIKDFEAEVQRRLKPKSSVDLYSLRPLLQDLELPAFSCEGQIVGEDIRHAPRNVRIAPNYLYVSVLPITWAKVDGWDAELELQKLVDVFKQHFDFMIETIVKIPNTSDAHSYLQRRVNDQIDKLGHKSLLIVLYNGHAKHTSGGMMLFGTNDDVQGVNWTDVTHTLNVADCDVIHVLDCCDALSATKGGGTQYNMQSEIAKEANLRTNESEYRGKNETLSAGAREERVPAGKASSMRVFADVLNKMALQNATITTHSWQQWTVTEVGQMWKEFGGARCATPHYKMNPLGLVGQSINLQLRERRSTI